MVERGPLLTLDDMMLKFHHFMFCQKLPVFSGRLVLDPAYIEECPGGENMIKLRGDIESTSGELPDIGTEFVLRNKSVLPIIQNEFKYVFFVVSDEFYLRDLPAFFDDEWDPSLKIHDLINIGWSVYAFSEPAILFGLYPIRVSEERVNVDEDFINEFGRNRAGREGMTKVDVDRNFINEFGLIKNRSLAEQVAMENNEADDTPNHGHWRAIGMFVDAVTYQRLESLLLELEKHNSTRGNK